MVITPVFVNMIGFIATISSIFMWVPQARITWQNRNDSLRLAGVSETTQWLSMIGYLLWGVFGVLSQSLWVTAPSLISFPLAIATIIVVRRGRRLHFTRSVPIISMAEPLSVTDTTASIPILSSGPMLGTDTTGSIPILSPGSVPVFATGFTRSTAVDTTGMMESPHPPTRPIPLFA